MDRVGSLREAGIAVVERVEEPSLLRYGVWHAQAIPLAFGPRGVAIAVPSGVSDLPGEGGVGMLSEPLEVNIAEAGSWDPPTDRVEMIHAFIARYEDVLETKLSASWANKIQKGKQSK